MTEPAKEKVRNALERMLEGAHEIIDGLRDLLYALWDLEKFGKDDDSL